MKWPLPKEHGAYGQLGAPLVTALAIGDFRPAALALSLGAVAGFLAHEPLLVLAGQRGQNALARDGTAARGWLGGLSLGAAGLLGLGLALMPPSARPWLLLPIGLALLVAAAIAARQEKTAAGEVIAAAALSSWALPVALAGGASVSSGLSCWLVFALIFAGATASVRGLIGLPKGRGRASRWIGAVLPLAGMVAMMPLAQLGRIPAALPWTLVPMACFGVVLLALAPNPRHLRRLGWALVAASIFTGALLVIVLR